MFAYQTGVIAGFLDHCDSLDQLKNEILPLVEDQKLAWMKKIRQIMEDGHFSQSGLASLCQVSRPAVGKWCRGALPQSRDMYIRIGLAAGYDLEEMNAFLQRFGRCPKLYAKSIEDAACIFVLSSDTLPHTYETAQLIQQELVCAMSDGGGDAVIRTGDLEELTRRFSSADELKAFVQANARSFRDAYAGLYSFVLAFLYENLGVLFTDGQERGATVHAMAEENSWPSSLRICVSEIRNRKWIPRRDKIISLGIHLNMDVPAINQMLALAKMEPLYPKNPVEAAIVWAINDVILNSEDGELYQDGSSYLCGEVYARLREFDQPGFELILEDLKGSGMYDE